MAEKELTVLPNEQVIQKLASTFPPEEQGKILREVFLVSQTKTTWIWDNKKKLWVYEAFTYVIACNSLGLNPTLNHIIVLEDQIYITLQGHLQNAHSSWLLMWIETWIVTQEDWNANAKWQKTKAFRYFCKIKKRAGDQIAEYRAEWYADLDTIKNKYASATFIEQMAEARAMRRCLARAFPVGMANIEDIQDDLAGNEKIEIVEDVNFILTEDIKNCTSLEELEALKDRISKSWSKNVIAEFSKKTVELKPKEEIKPTILETKWLENNQIAKQSKLVPNK